MTVFILAAKWWVIKFCVQGVDIVWHLLNLRQPQGGKSGATFYRTQDGYWFYSLDSNFRVCKF